MATATDSAGNDSAAAKASAAATDSTNAAGYNTALAAAVTQVITNRENYQWGTATGSGISITCLSLTLLRAATPRAFNAVWCATP